MPVPDGPRRALRCSRREALQHAGGALAALLAVSLAPRRAFAHETLVLPGGIATRPRPPRPAAPGGGSLDEVIRRSMRIAHVPSLAGAVVKGPDLVWARGYGRADREANVQADPDTVYMLASISKTIICAAVMKLWEAGSLDLDADVNDYLDFPVRNPSFPDRKITPRQVLTHTSSIRDRYSVWGTISNPTPQGYCRGDSPISLDRFLRGYLVPGGEYYQPSNYYDVAPGRRYHYSNIGADVGAKLVEAISGTDFNEFCKSHIFTPLGMSQTGFRLADISTPNLAMPYRWNFADGAYEPYFHYGYADYPCGALRTSARNLSRWLRCFMNGGSLDGVRVLKRSTVKEIMRPQIPGNWWQGLIWYYKGRGGNLRIGHNGGDYGVDTSMFFEVGGDTGALYLANRYIAGWKAWYAMKEIEQRLFQR